MALTISVIVCAHNEAGYLRSCLYSLLAQSRPPEEILVINNASTDETGAVAAPIPGVRVVDEPRKGLVIARERGRREAVGTLLVYLDADCRAPLTWLARVEDRLRAGLSARRFMTSRHSVATSSSADPLFHEAVGRIRAEFIEMPDLKLTLLQAARLCAMDLATCAAVLASLVEARFLVVTRDAYMRE